MFEIRWVQNESTVIRRELTEALGSSEFAVSMAIKDLLYCIAYNEDSQLSNLDFFQPLHLEVRFEYWAESVVYSSLHQKTIFSHESLVIGADVHSFYGFYTAHQVLWESKRFKERKKFMHGGPLYDLFYWRFMSDQGIQVNILLDREYSFKIYIGSFIEVNDSPTEHIDIQEEHRRSLSTEQFYAEQPQFFEVLAHPIKGMQAYSKKHSCCSICNAIIEQELEYGYCMDCAKEFLLPFSEKTEGRIDYEGLRLSKLVDKSDFYSGNDYEYWVTPDGELGSRDTSLPF